jgi:lipoprotein-anchoring transpeptidase ErfK/SrfK
MGATAGILRCPVFSAILGLVLVSIGQAETKSKQAPARPSIRYDLSAINNPRTQPQLDEGAEGSAVLRAQILLDRAHFSPGEIDGRMGANAVRAVEGFRSAHGLSSGSSIDADVWKALNMDSAPAIVDYALTEADVKGPFVKVPSSMMLKARLKYLGYGSALEGVAEKFHASPAVLRRLNPGSKFNAAGRKIHVPGIGPPLKARAARVVVSKAESTVKVLNDMGQVIAQYPCTSGSEHDPLPIGEWQVTGVLRNPKFHYNPDLFWDAKAQDSKAMIAAGPNNPVGRVWIDLSKEHYGIHGTPSPALIGHTESHGCIRLTNWSALELAGMVDKGTPVSLTE